MAMNKLFWIRSLFFSNKEKSPMVLSCFSTKPWANLFGYCLGLLTEECAFIDNLPVLV